MAMADPSVTLVDDNGWHLQQENEKTSSTVVSPKGETLVVNHTEIKHLGIAKEILPKQAFLTLMSPHVSSTAATPTSESPTLEGVPITHKELEEQLRSHILYNHEGKNSIGHILIDDRNSGINQSTWLYVKAALDHYKKNKPAFIILELNTPGGEVFAAQQISDALKNFDIQEGVPVVAYVNNWAISAGAMLAYSCRFMAVVKDGSMGAAEPLTQDAAGKMEVASEKVNSAIRTDFANRARFFDRNPLLAEAMVDKDLILVMRHGRVTKLDNETQIRLTGPDPDVVISPKGKLLTLDAQQMLEYGVADMLVPPTKTEAITEQEKEEGQWRASKEALFHLPFFEGIPGATIDSYRMDWKTRFFAILASPMVSSLLFMGLVIGFYMELSSPGFTLPGSIAAICLFLILLSSFSLEIANWLELIFLITGLITILVELFVLPTFGLLGFVGLLLFLVGLFGMMIPGVENVSFEYDTQTLNAAGQVFVERLAWLSGALVAALAIIAILARYVTPNFSAFNRFVLNGNEQDGYLAVDAPSTLPKAGALGEASTALRPAGKVIIDNMQYDAISDGTFIEKGMKIKVTGLDGGTVVVAREGEIS
jgi:membrane-bound ClpP family serine protease